MITHYRLASEKLIFVLNNAMAAFGRRSSSHAERDRVFLNVYDLNEQSNEFLYPLGLGVYHSGVEISGVEYTFAGESGIYEMTPKHAPPAKFRESIDLGLSPGAREISNAIEELKKSFKGTDYHVLNKNCNHFAGFDYLSVGKPSYSYCEKV